MMTVPILTAHVERYISLRQVLGFKLRDVARELRAYARYAEAKGDTYCPFALPNALKTQAERAFIP